MLHFLPYTPPAFFIPSLGSSPGKLSRAAGLAPLSRVAQLLTLPPSTAQLVTTRVRNHARAGAVSASFSLYPLTRHEAWPGGAVQ